MPSRQREKAQEMLPRQRGDPFSIEYARLSRIHDRVFEQFTSHSEKFFGREATMAAVSDFLLLDDENEGVWCGFEARRQDS